MDLSAIQMGLASRSSSTDMPAWKKANSLAASGLEHSVLEQAQGAENPAVSTVKLLTLSNASGKKLFRATGANWTTGFNVRNRLQNYPANILMELDAAIIAGETCVLPEDANITLDDWTGIGYVRYGSTGFGMLIAGGLNGAYSANNSSVYSPPVVRNVVQTVYAPPPPAQVQLVTSSDPVDLFTGNLLFDHTDLRLGEGAIRGLAFSRHYNSAQRSVSRSMGSGWRHSYDITATEISDAAARFGSRRLVDTVPAIVQNYINSRLMTGTPGPKEWAVASIVTQWGTDQLVDNAVHLRLGGRSLEFVAQPDGSYVPPAGATTELTRTNGTYRLAERFGKTYQFNANGRIASITDADGNDITFSYNAQTNLQSVTDARNRSLTFTYSNDKISQVSDGTSRSISFGYIGDDLTTLTDPDGNQWVYQYDDQHQLVVIEDPLSQVTASNIYNDIGQVVTQYNGYGEAWAFNCGGPQSTESDPLGNTTTYYFDDAGRGLGIEYPIGSRTYKVYDAQGLLVTNMDANGHATILGYDAHHNPTNRIDALGKAWAYEYDSEHRLIAERDPLGSTTRYQYDSEHHPTVVSNALGGTVTTTYTADGLPLTVTDVNGNQATYTYDTYGNPQTIARTDGGTVTNTWNARGELLVTRDPHGNATTYTYDNRGLVTSVTDADGNVTSNIYNAAGHKTQTIDPRGNATTYTYTPTYEISTCSYPDGSSVSNTYDSADRLIATTDGEGKTITFTYDSAGRRIAVTDPLGNAVRYALDPNGNTLATTNALGHIAYNAVDPLNRVTNAWDQVGSQTRANAAEFDAAGRQTATVNPLGQRTQFSHDALGRVITTTRSDLATEHNAYDAVGNLLSYTNAKNVAIVQTTYDGQSRPIAQTNARGNGKSWTYDAAGNLISRRDAEGAETQYIYDRMNRIDRIEYPDNSVVGFAYDGAGNMLTATNADAAVSFGYDPMNRITSVTSSVHSVYSVVQYSHDKNGNRTGLTLPGNKTVTYTYDDANRLSDLQVSGFSLQPFSFTYDDANRLTGISYPNGVTAAYTYDDGGRLTGLTYSKSGSAFIDRAYTYNALGQITKRTITAGLEAVPPDTHQYLRHNAADQLTHVSRMDNYENPEQWRDVGPAYDANGAVTNITTRYNGLTLDNAFTWDYEGRLTAYSGEHQTNLWFVAPPIPANLAFKYDALGGRIARTGPTGGEKIHVLDQAAPLKNMLVQRASNGTIERYYIYAPGFGLVAHIEADGTARYYHGDHLGSTIALTDASGNVTDQFNYTPYGELMARTGTTDTPYTFCGRHGVYWEGGSLYHMKARYYRADIARFISPDPLGIAGGVNLYAYANGDPVRFLDALGLCAESGDRYNSELRATPASARPYHDNPGLSLAARQLQARQYAPGADANSFVGLLAAEQHGRAIGAVGGSIVGSVALVQGVSISLEGAALLSAIVDRAASAVSAWQPMASFDSGVLYSPGVAPVRDSVGDIIYRTQPYLEQFGAGLSPGPGGPFQRIGEGISWWVGSEVSEMLFE